MSDRTTAARVAKLFDFAALEDQPKADTAIPTATYDEWMDAQQEQEERRIAWDAVEDAAFDLLQCVETVSRDRLPSQPVIEAIFLRLRDMRRGIAGVV